MRWKLMAFLVLHIHPAHISVYVNDDDDDNNINNMLLTLALRCAGWVM